MIIYPDWPKVIFRQALSECGGSVFRQVLRAGISIVGFIEVVFWIAPFAVADRLADGKDALFQAKAAGEGILIQAGLAFIELVTLPVSGVRDVGHDDVCPGQEAKLAPGGHQGLEGRRGGDVDVLQGDAAGGDHLQTFFQGRLRVIT